MLGRVYFTSDGLKEIFNQPHKNLGLKNKLATVSDQLLKNSQLLKQAPGTKGKGLGFYYLKVEGMEDMYIVVKERFDGKKILYSITERIK